jgi:PHD/YefM family antitoxin component YafN of YafNO toxin-antitoxin module
MPSRVARATRRVSATEFRSHVKDYLRKAKGESVVLVENRRQEPKYIVDKEWFDSLMRDAKSTMATLEVLADRDLTARLLSLSKTLDDDLRAGRLHTMEEVFGE